MFQKAQRKQVRLKLAITGPSGSGKTYSALRMASGMGKKIAVIDTENGSASLYADKFDFDTVQIQPPFTIEKYTQAIEGAEKAGYEILVIDSITHAWAGEGGLLEQKTGLDVRGGNSYTNWASITTKDNQFRNAFLHSGCHIICTMRSKQDYSLEENDKGKKVPVKIGLAPVQRDGLEYEFTTVFDIAMDHKAITSKDRTGLFVDKVFQVTEKTGAVFIEWMKTGLAVVDATKGAFTVNLPEVEPPTFKAEEGLPSALPVTAAQHKQLVEYTKERRIPAKYVNTVLQEEFHVKEFKQLNQDQFGQLMEFLGTR